LLTNLRVPRAAALYLIAAVVTMTSVVSFVESYRALFVWATHHQVFGNYAAIWPLMIDSFILVGEATLFVSLVDRWSSRSRIYPWAVTLGGLAVSVAGNVGHVVTHDYLTRMTAAVAPLAASVSLTVGLGVLKRIAAYQQQTEQEPATKKGVDPKRSAAAHKGVQTRRQRAAASAAKPADFDPADPFRQADYMEGFNGAGTTAPAWRESQNGWREPVS